MKTSSINYCGSLFMIALASLFVLELSATFAVAYPASYSSYYAPVGLEEQNPNYVNLQQAIERIRQAFIQNNELENRNDVDRAISDLLELSRGALDVWFRRYQEKSKLMLNENIGETEKEAKRSGIAEIKNSQIDRFTLDGTLKRTADFGSQRGHTGQREYALRTIPGWPRQEPNNNFTAPKVRRQSLVNCSQIMAKAGLDFGTRQSDAGSIENCLMTLRTELNRLGK